MIKESDLQTTVENVEHTTYLTCTVCLVSVKMHSHKNSPCDDVSSCPQWDPPSLDPRSLGFTNFHQWMNTVHSSMSLCPFSCLVMSNPFMYCICVHWTWLNVRVLDCSWWYLLRGCWWCTREIISSCTQMTLSFKPNPRSERLDVVTWLVEGPGFLRMHGFEWSAWNCLKL